MSLLAKLFAAANAVKAGESLQDPSKWKNVQLLMLPFGVILAAIFNFAGIDITEAQLNAVNYGLATLGVIINGYLTVATSAKVGINVISK